MLSKKQLEKLRRITILWAPTKEAFLVKEGPQMSEITWGDANYTEHVANDQINFFNFTSVADGDNETNQSHSNDGLKEEENRMPEMTGPQVLSAYNKIATRLGKPTVKKFQNLSEGVKRLNKLKSESANGKTKEAKAKVAKAKPAKAKSESKKTSRSPLNPEDTITILESENSSRGKTGEMWNHLASLKRPTVEEFTKTGSASYLTWWRDRGKIKIG